MATKKKRAQTQAEVDVDVAAFLEGNAGGAPKKKGKKDAIPEIDTAKALADKANKANKALKDAKATLAAVEAEVLEITGPKYEARAKSGDFTKSFNLAGEATPGVQVSYKDAFSAFPIEEKGRLQEALGERYSQYFETKREITVSDTSDDTVKLLLEKLGAEEFKRIFQIGVSVVAKADMDRKQFELPEIVRPVQHKASVKVRK